jgi:rubrerythrin
MLKVWRCKICGDPYLGKEKPTECPFCGADAEYIVAGKDYDIPDVVTLGDKSKENLQAALKLEIGAVNLYECAKKKAEKEDNAEGFALFKALIKVEKEHATRMTKFLELPRPDYSDEGCADKYEDNLKETEKREDNAVKLYKQFAEEAVEPVIKQFFEALVEIEQGHSDLAKELTKNFVKS